MIWLARKVISLWVRGTVRPQDVAARLKGRGRPLCYVLERKSLADLAVLLETAADLGLPRPGRRLRAGGFTDSRSVCYLERSAGLIRSRIDRRPPVLLAQLVAAAADPSLDVDIVPVAIYWGRAPQKEGSLFRLWLSENWALTGAFRKCLTVLFNGRHTIVQFGDPLPLRSFMAAGIGPSRTLRRTSRTLRGWFRTQRAATIGPDLSHRRTIVAQVLATRAVRAAVAQEMKDKNIKRREALLTAKRFADEIAANYSHAFVRFMEGLLSRLWNRLYDGVEIHHLQTLQKVAEGNELVFVPCHRSHMDYLLISYIIYKKGFAVPHTAAGINLNMPVIGRFLRKGGAFFLRRTFRGSSLYPVVFTKYLGIIMARGHSLEYFIEGGRSRTGRLLQPKTGMLSMTVRGFLDDPQRPVIFLPVYFGYERLVEGETYIDELSGRPKQKESIWGLLKTLPQLRQKFGKVHVSLGEPIALTELLDKHDPAWLASPGRAFNPAAVSPVVDELARGIMTHINCAATVTPVNLLAVTLLAMPRQAMLETDLVRQLDLYRELLRGAPYSTRVVLAALNDLPADGKAIVRYGEEMKLLERRAHPLGDIMRMNEQNAILMTYFRNNVLHLFAMPSLLACCFIGNTMVRTEDLQRLAWRVYPYIADELFLPWREEQLPQVIRTLLDLFAANKLLEPSADGTEWRRRPPSAPEAMQLSVLAQGTIQIVERYYLAVAVLLQAGSDTITQEALVSRCQSMAQRIAMLYDLSAPEFFDRTLFDNFIDLLRRRGVIQLSREGRLTFNGVLMNVANDAQLVLSEQIRHSILQVTHA